MKKEIEINDLERLFSLLMSHQTENKQLALMIALNSLEINLFEFARVLAHYCKEIKEDKKYSQDDIFAFLEIALTISQNFNCQSISEQSNDRFYPPNTLVLEFRNYDYSIQKHLKITISRSKKNVIKDLCFSCPHNVFETLFDIIFNKDALVNDKFRYMSELKRATAKSLKNTKKY